MANLSITVRNVGAPEKAKTQALILLLPERKTLPKSLKTLDIELDGTVARTLKLGDFTGSAGSHRWLPGRGNVQRVLLIGCGDTNKMSVANAKKISEGLAKTLVGSAAEDALISFSGLPPKISSISQLI